MSRGKETNPKDDIVHFPSSRRRRAVPVVRQSSGNPGENIPPKPVRRSISLPRGTSSGWEVGAAPSKGGVPSLDSSRISYFRSLESGKHEADATLPWVLHTFTHRWVKWPEIWGGGGGGRTTQPYRAAFGVHLSFSAATL